MQEGYFVSGRQAGAQLTSAFALQPARKQELARLQWRRILGDDALIVLTRSVAAVVQHPFRYGARSVVRPTGQAATCSPSTTSATGSSGTAASRVAVLTVAVRLTRHRDNEGHGPEHRDARHPPHDLTVSDARHP